MGELAVVLSSYAQASMQERAAGAVLDREDEGFFTWSPEGLYERLSANNPELYPIGPAPTAFVEAVSSEAFRTYLEDRRKHRVLSRMPADILAETIGRRVVELVTSEIYRRVQDPDRLALMDIDQLRKLWKDGFGLLAPSQKGKGAPKEDGSGDVGGVTLAQLRTMTAALDPDQRRAVLDTVTRELAGPAIVVEVQADEGD